VPAESGHSKIWIKVKHPKAPAAIRTIEGYVLMNVKVVVAILLIAAAPVYAQSPGVPKVSTGRTTRRTVYEVGLKNPKAPAATRAIDGTF
jgi:hypothetical protein